MSTAHMVCIRGLSKAKVLAALYNASAPLGGAGFVMAMDGPVVMDLSTAQEYIDKRHGDLMFDRVYGRPIKADLSEDKFDPAAYDAINGGVGVARRIIEKLRKTGSTYLSYVYMMHVINTMSGIFAALESMDRAYDSVVTLYLVRELRTMPEVEPDLNLADLPEAPGLEAGTDHLRWSADEAMRYYDEDPDLAVVVFIALVRQHEGTAWIATQSRTVARLACGYRSRDAMYQTMLEF